ncbi:hypothetical protein [Psychrobacillus sp. OK032]|uniref:hypothetical protein n=1 Tax=Psychrobacillus sp. OK032 TaxID=1884358 RepID=UPI0008C6CF2D|nr:hypothetical protein [Psychrobacillus sp. OK032]SES46072.1 hypothetical protein SAMN05518872_1237 [Psychrobacillus sp. OK032]
MNYLVSKTKGVQGEFFKVLSSEKDIYLIPQNLENGVPYSPSYKLEEDEWFTIDDFSNKEFYIEFLSRTFISTDYNQVTKQNYSKLEYLCSVQGGTYFFQKIYESNLIKKKFLSMSATPVLVDSENEPILILNKIPDAIYDQDFDLLYFKKLSALTSIFRGIETLYKEATQVETEEFLKNDFIRLEEGYNVNKVKTANRKRIALAMDTLGTYSPQDQQSIFAYTKEYCGELQYDENHKFFRIKSEDDLKKLLYGIEQRYYTTLLGNEKRLANSVMVLNN